MTELLTRLLGQSLQDVILGGVVDLDCDPADFVPLLGCVYLDIAGHLIQLSRDERTIQLNVSCVDAVHLDCELEDTQRICRSSVGRYILTDPLADNRIARINLYTNKNDGVIAIEFILASCQVLFFE